VKPLPRVIPVLLVHGVNLVKTVRFKRPGYIGDPANTVRIFNELRVDEIIVLDIRASKRAQGPNWSLIKELAEECHMPLCYGGGIRNVEDARKLFSLGLEKVSLNTGALNNPGLVQALAEEFGSQSVVGSVDISSSVFGGSRVHDSNKRFGRRRDPVQWARELVTLGVGELLVTSIDREGTWAGFDGETVNAIARQADVPVIAHGGCGSLAHIRSAVDDGASAVGVGSFVVYQKKDFGVLVNFPDLNRLEQLFQESSDF
jgi:imidazole glycerol-phosphate synthase subunit HisF